MASRRPDVLVVGLGAAGAIVASELAVAGLRVLALDKGSWFDPEEFRLKHDEIRYYARGAIVPGMAHDPITWRPDPSTKAVVLPWATGPLGTGDPLHLPPSLGAGGGSIHWGAVCWRFRRTEFKMRTTITERLGKDFLSPDVTLVDWPIGYDQLEPYYDKVEWEQGISGKAGNVRGERADEGNPFEEWRRRDYPMPPLRAGAADHAFHQACKRLGYHPFRQAAAINSVAFKGRSACTYCGFCHGFPCHVDAKSSTLVTSIPNGLASGNLEIRDRCRVFRINRETGGRRVTGVSYFSPEGARQDVEADTVVLACYALENARLLLASQINKSGEVGKHFMTHAFGWLSGLTEEASNPFMGPLVAASAIEDFSGELVHEYDHTVAWGAPVISVPGDLQPIEAVHGMPKTAPQWGSEFKRWLKDNYRHLYGMYSQTANLPSLGCFVDLDPSICDRYGEPALRITHSWSETDRRSVEFLLTIKRRIAREMRMKTWWEEPSTPPYHLSTHEVGTHRMGEDPATSVVDVFGRSHECENLFVIGGGQFPSYGGYNPTQTIQALAYMTADHMLERPLLEKSPDAAGPGAVHEGHAQ